VELIALVARYHRKAEPDLVRHPDYAAMSGVDRYRIDWLAGILRVADGLDRGHEQWVRSVRAIRLSEQRVVEAVGTGGMEEEILGARKKSGLLATVWGGPVMIEPTPA
jgi:exopolyphosphatase/guanosine-5'-triphosphate,3'-diphosphate pyrophosphatase